MNKFVVAAAGDKVAILNPAAVRPMPPADAINLAAWLVVLAEAMTLTTDPLIAVDVQKALADAIAEAKRS